MKFKGFAWVFVGTSVSIMGLVFGCASSKKAEVSTAPVLVYSSHKKVPSWLTSIPEEKDYLYFVGTARDTENFDSGKKEALNDALGQVVSTIGVNVTATSSYEERYYAEQFQTTLQTELFTKGRAQLQDAELKEIYYEKYEKPDGTSFFRVWVLLKYSREEIKKEQERLAELLRLRYGEVLSFEEEASRYLGDKLLMNAVFAHLNAAASALKIEDGDVFFDRNIIRATELLMKLGLRKYGEDQIGFVGKPLPEPLVLEVFYRGSGGEEIPVPDVPVSFSYRVPRINMAGYRIEVYNLITDRTGKASLQIDMIHEVSDTNKVEAWIDLKAALNQFSSVPTRYQESLESLQDVISTKRVTFLFRSDTAARSVRTAVYFIQLDERNKPLPKPVTAPVFYDIMYSKRFSIKVLDVNPGTILEKSESEVLESLWESAGKGVERLLFGRVKIVEYDTVAGFQTALAV
ncbi:MAG: hypothetical protein ACUVWJ_10695, partial [Spirochaetota bacterium]